PPALQLALFRPSHSAAVRLGAALVSQCFPGRLRTRMHWLCMALTGFVAVAAWPALAAAHGMAGQRFFPSTLTIDDPFVADELSLPTILPLKQPRGRAGQAGPA